MKHPWALAIVLLGISAWSAVAGDSIYGRITAVRSGQIVVLNYGQGEYVVRLVGIDVPTGTQARAQDARAFVSKLLLAKNGRLQFERRAPNGEMIGRMYTDDPAIGIQDVGLELLRAGLARRQANYNDKTGTMAAAEKEAQTARRGLWAAPLR
jgi:endonuclease YncB( thermonuclease family)